MYDAFYCYLKVRSVLFKVKIKRGETSLLNIFLAIIIIVYRIVLFCYTFDNIFVYPYSSSPSNIREEVDIILKISHTLNAPFN